MNVGLRSAWKKFRQRRWLSLAFDVAVLLIVFFGVHAWQTRNLPVDQPAPVTRLTELGSGQRQDAVRPGEVGVVYFFAPWCRVCRASIDNLDELVDDDRIGWGTVVALDYADAGEVQEFVDAVGVSLPVLLGDPRTAADWSVRAFPTYYVIDAAGKISSRSVGYSTWLGMWVRGWFAR